MSPVLPVSPQTPKIGSKAQALLPPEDSPHLDVKGIKHVQQIAGSILCYARAVDMTVLMTLSSIAVEQTKVTTRTMGQCIELLDYLATNSDAKVRFHASDMVMNIHLDASYLSKTMARSATFSWDGRQKMAKPSD
jgi:hypothetical protein